MASWWTEQTVQADHAAFSTRAAQELPRMRVTKEAALVDALQSASVATYQDRKAAKRAGGMGMKAGAI